MSTVTVSRLPSRLPKSGKTVNGIPTGQQQKTLTTPSKLQKVSVKTKLKSPPTGINKSPNDNTPTSTTTQSSPQSTTTNNVPTAAITKTTTSKLRPPIKTNIDATNKSSKTNIDATNKSSKTNIDATNKSSKTNIDVTNKSSKTNIDVTNKSSKTNIDVTNKSSKTNIDATNKSSKTNIDATNKSSKTNIDATNKSSKTNIDATNKSSPVRSMLPSPKSSISSSSITNDPKNTAKRNLVAQTAKQTSISKRKNEDTPSRNVRAAPSPNTKKSSIQTPKSITAKNTPRKKATSVQEQSRISTKKSLNSTIPTRKNELLIKIEELQAENKKLQAENKELMHEKGLLTVDVCQMEHRLACEESRVFELEVDVADLRCLLNGKHNQLDRNSDHYRNELEIANNLIMEQAVTMSDQQSLIEELMAQLDEQENICQNLQNVISNFKTKHNILDELKDINFVWKIF